MPFRSDDDCKSYAYPFGTFRHALERARLDASSDTNFGGLCSGRTARTGRQLSGLHAWGSAWSAYNRDCVIYAFPASFYGDPQIPLDDVIIGFMDSKKLFNRLPFVH